MASITIFGAGGKLGSRLVIEAASRGHKVHAVARDLSSLQTFGPAVEPVLGDVTSPDSVEALANADVLVSAVGGPDKAVYLKAAQTLVSVVDRRNGSGPRIFHSGGAGSLLNAEGVRLVDTAAVPEPFRDEMLGQAAALDFYRTSGAGVSWTYLSPPPLNFRPGQRTGAYRLGIDHPVHGPDGEMGISYEDYSVVVVDEIERPSHLNSRFTVGY